jgi:hypothetical protein
MKFLATDGRAHNVDIRPSRWPRREPGGSKSNFQQRVGESVDSVFPQDIILEEFFIPGDRLYIDFFLPRRSIAVEAQGIQHYEYNVFFHGTKENFKRSKERDGRKKLWCELNNIRLVVIGPKDKHEEVVDKLLSD